LRDASGIARWPAVPLEIGFNALALPAFLVLRKCRLLAGQHFHLYLMSYGAFRFAHEFARATPRSGTDSPAISSQRLLFLRSAWWAFSGAMLPP
jgi:prolipoprotein diacylglyceryltransferase